MSSSTPSQTRFTVAVACRSSAGDVRRMLGQLQTETAAHGLATGDWQTLELVLAEALNNVVEHAYREESDHPIHLVLSCADNLARASIRDRGIPLPKGRLPEGKPANLDVPIQDLPEGGFGWFMIQTLASRVVYNCQAGENTLELHVPLMPVSA